MRKRLKENQRQGRDYLVGPERTVFVTVVDEEDEYIDESIHDENDGYGGGDSGEAEPTGDAEPADGSGVASSERDESDGYWYEHHWIPNSRSTTQYTSSRYESIRKTGYLRWRKY